METENGSDEEGWDNIVGQMRLCLFVVYLGSLPHPVQVFLTNDYKAEIFSFLFDVVPSLTLTNQPYKAATKINS